jgi:hypothetical protein
VVFAVLSFVAPLMVASLGFLTLWRWLAQLVRGPRNSSGGRDLDDA